MPSWKQEYCGPIIRTTSIAEFVTTLRNFVGRCYPESARFATTCPQREFRLSFVCMIAAAHVAISCSFVSVDAGTTIACESRIRRLEQRASSRLFTVPKVAGECVCKCGTGRLRSGPGQLGALVPGWRPNSSVETEPRQLSIFQLLAHLVIEISRY